MFAVLLISRLRTLTALWLSGGSQRFCIAGRSEVKRVKPGWFQSKYCNAQRPTNHADGPTIYCIVLLQPGQQ